ncbi:ATP-binding protein [Flavobacteriales bacterium]|nr:ATP-binding protein [Flavobacteriales bacterium]
MKINTPIRIAIFLSVFIFVFALVIFYLFDNQSDGIMVFFLFLFFLITYSLIYYVVKRFFHEKIKVVYKNIYKFKGTSRLQDLDVENVEKEAEDWANKQEKQLIKLQTDENYRREFIGNVSHELKTPIFNIQGYIQTLLDGGINDSDVNLKFLNRANKSVDRMINIVEDLEVISKLETDKEELLIEHFNITIVAQEAIDQLEMKANEENISLLFSNESSTDFVMGDKDKIQQVFMNLISNSIKYGKSGGQTRVRFFDMDDNIMIEVADNGIGIDEDALPRLFERFYRVDKNRSREIGGTGLGLAIVKHIIEAHNQTINVRSTKNIGSTFSFILEKKK